LEERSQYVPALISSVLGQAPGIPHVNTEAVQFVLDHIGRVTLSEDAGLLERRYKVP
jgi:hypothetical protein